MSRVWALLKELRRVTGAKRKLSDADWHSSEQSSAELVDPEELQTSGSEMPELGSSLPSSSSDTAGDSARVSTGSGTGSTGTSASSVSLIRRRMSGIMVNEQSSELGETVEVDGVERVPVLMVGSGRYLDDVFVVPGPSTLSADEQEIHDMEHLEYELMMNRMGDDYGDEADSEHSSEVGGERDSGVEDWEPGHAEE